MEKEIPFYAENRTPIVKPVVNGYNDCATPVQKCVSIVSSISAPGLQFALIIFLAILGQFING
jgi:hypothetical protein